MSETRWITIYFTDGTDISFKFPDQEIADHLMQSAFERMLGQQMLVLEGEGSVYMFPYSNIKYIKVQPVIGSLPDGTIIDVQLLK